jgi:hypothetical protein
MASVLRYAFSHHVGLLPVSLGFVDNDGGDSWDMHQVCFEPHERRNAKLQ